MLAVDGVQVVSNDFNQTNTERSGTKVLTAGWHDIEVQWRKRTTTGVNLTVNYQLTTAPTMPKTTMTSNNGPTLFFGTEINATTPASPPPPSAPTNLAITNPTPTTIALSWQDNAVNETSFTILRSYKQNTNYVIYRTLPANATSFQDPGLFANATYYYKVQANGLGGSSTSVEISSTTMNNPPTLTAMQNASMKYGHILDMVVISSDIDGDPITLSVTGLPAFATFTDYGDGTGNIHFAPAASPALMGDYPMTVKAQDNHAGLSTSPFTLTVSDKDKPSILPITSPAVSEGQKANFIIVAQSDFGAQKLTWSFKGLPSFALYTIDATGQCNVVMSPGFADSGPYSVSVSVTDPLASTTTSTFSINVTDVNPNTKFYVNMVNSTSASAPWNNMTSPTLSALNNSNGTATAVGVDIITSPPNWFGTFNMGAVTGNNSGVFPDNVLKDYFYFGFNGGPNTVDVKVSGLDIAKKYYFTFLGSSVFNLGGVTDNGSTLYTIGSRTVSLRVQNNTQNVATINSIVPNPDATVTFTMSKANGTAAGYLNAFTFEAVYADGTPPAAPRNVTAAVSGGTVNVTWIDAPFNEDGFDIYRSTSSAGPFVKINTMMAPRNSTNYVDNTIVSGVTYYYEAKAVNVFGESPFSNVAQVSLPNLPPVINVTGDFTVTPGSFGMLDVIASNNSTLTISGLPGFAILSPVSPYESNIILLPAGTDAGVYNVLATAVDGIGQTTIKTIAVTVSQSVLWSVSLNFTANTLASAPWNNTAKQPAVNDTFSNLKNNSGSGSGVNVILQTAFGGAYDQGATTGNNSGVVPDAVLHEYYWFGIFSAPSEEYIKVTGLNTGNQYRFKFVASSVFTNNGTITNNGSTVFSIGSKSASVNVQNNTTNLGIIEGVTTNNVGEVLIHLTKGVNAAAGYINGMIIEALPLDAKQFDPTGLVAAGYSSTQVNLTWNDNSPLETGYEIQRSTTGIDGSWAVINTTVADVAAYVDMPPQSGKLYYYKVRANTATVPSNFSNVARAGTVAFKVYINIKGDAAYDAPVPWNNTSRFGFTGDTFYGFRDDTGNNTGLMMTVGTQLESSNNWGMVTGTNAGVFPDKVLNAFWFNDAFFPAGVFFIDGIDQTYSYNFGFMGSINVASPVNTDFTIGNTTVTNRNDQNISNVSYIRNVRPDADSRIGFTVRETSGSPWSIWNALVIEGFPSGGLSAVPGGRMSNPSAARTNGNMKEIRYGMAANALTFYPNPVLNIMNVEVDDSSIGEMQYHFYDLTGREVHQGVYQNASIKSEFSIDVDLPPALYIMKVTYPDGRMDVQKFVKN
jgi:hypothetical protein